MKTTHLRARQLEITVSFYSLARGLRTAYHAKEDSWGGVRGSGSGY